MKYALFALPLLLAACALNNGEARMAAVEKRVETIEVNQSDQAIQLSDIREKQAVGASAEVQLRRLEDAVEELRGEVNALRTALQEMQTPPAPAAAQPVPTPTGYEPAAAGRRPEPTPVVDSSLNPEDEYQKGRNLYVAQRFQEAAAQFRAFLQLFPNHELDPNSQYWLGECLYDQEDYLGALNEFQNVIDFYPDSKKAADAQLKIGLCYRGLGKRDQARLELERVLRMYPDYERKDLVNSLLKELR